MYLRSNFLISFTLSVQTRFVTRNENCEIKYLIIFNRCKMIVLYIYITNQIIIYWTIISIIAFMVFYVEMENEMWQRVTRDRILSCPLVFVFECIVNIHTYLISHGIHTGMYDSLQRKLRLSHVYKWMIPICFCESREWENSEAGINGAYTCCVYIYIYIFYTRSFLDKEKD